jgi:DTW domain-containing protein YfiP
MDVHDPAEPVAEDCPRCGKTSLLCICAGIEPADNQISLLILQHPQEQDKALGTARLAALHFADAQLKIGLSWPSLSKILGRDVDPQRWGILYLGSANAMELAPEAEILALDKKGQPEDRQNNILRELQGVIVLDGTWSQAKALWWRNAWMLKCRRLILNPAQRSRYGQLRREARADALSTIESAAMLLSRLEGRSDLETTPLASFEKLLARYKDLKKTDPNFDRPAGGTKADRFRRAKAMRRRRQRS